MSGASSSSSSSSVAATSIRIGFNAQTFKAKQKDKRHEHLQANVKPSDLTDNDKIFLLKREIDNLRSQVYVDSGSFRNVDNQNQQNQNQAGLSSSSSSAATAASNSNNSMSTMMSSRIPLVTIMLAVGVLLLASRFLRQKLSQIRTADSLLRIDDGDDDDDDGTIMIELQSSTTSLSQQQQQAVGDGEEGWQHTSPITVTDHHHHHHHDSNRAS